MSIKPDEKINVLLEGAIGTGKTTSLRTIVENTDKELFVLSTEPGIHTILGDLPEAKAHWHYIPAAVTPWDILIDNAKKVNMLPMASLQALPGLNRHEYQQFITVLNVLADYTCQRTGESFGPVDSWGPDRVIVIDGLSGLSTMAMELVVGAKPIRTQPEWGVAQSNLMGLLKKLTDDTKCSFVLIAHTAKKEDRLSGGMYTTVSTIGQAIVGDIPKNFDEVLMVVRNGDKFNWSTIESNTDLKTRTLEFSDTIAPDFGQLFGRG